jgi:hypothetical protein
VSKEAIGLSREVDEEDDDENYKNANNVKVLKFCPRDLTCYKLCTEIKISLLKFTNMA